MPCCYALHYYDRYWWLEHTLHWYRISCHCYQTHITDNILIRCDCHYFTLLCHTDISALTRHYTIVRRQRHYWLSQILLILRDATLRIDNIYMSQGTLYWADSDATYWYKSYIILASLRHAMMPLFTRATILPHIATPLPHIIADIIDIVPPHTDTAATPLLPQYILRTGWCTLTLLTHW